MPQPPSVSEGRTTPDGPVVVLSDGAVVGTSSVRRMAQVRRRFPRLRFEDVRGNIDTRLRKLDAADSEYSALILAAAGLSRMGLLARASQFLDAESGMLHAVGQGGLGLEAREERPGKWSLHFGAQKISLQDAADLPTIARGTVPGSGNFCLVVREAIEARGAELMLVPSYSHDLNPIEQVFAKLKALLRKAAPRTREALWRTIGEKLSMFTPAECRNYLRHCGYGHPA